MRYILTPVLALALCAHAPVPTCAADATPAPAAPVSPGYLGVGLDEVDETLAYHLGLRNDLGVVVTMVAPGSPAAAMGLVEHDVIVGCDGQPIYTPRALSGLIRGKHAGDVVSIEVRRGANTVTLKGALVARPPESEEMPRGPGFGPSLIPRPHHEHGQKRGTVRQPDGSTMEWSIEDGGENKAPAATEAAP